MKKSLCVLSLAACLLLTGCRSLPTPREMGDMALLRTMGVDRAGEELLVTVSTGPRAKGIRGEDQSALVLSAQRPSLSGAALALQGLSDSHVFFGYVDQLLLGEGLARQGVIPTLDYFARDTELGLGARLWIVRGNTGENAVRSGGDQGVEGRLTTLRTDGELGVAAISRTAGEVYSDLLEQGASYAPALASADEEKGAALVDGGYAVLKGDRLAGFLDGEAARGLELLAGKPSAHVLSVNLPGNPVTVRVSGAVTTCRFSRDGKLMLNCRVNARLAEYGTPLTQGEWGQVQRVLEERERARVRSTLDQLRGWEADCLGLGSKAALTAPGLWSVLEKEWPRQFGAWEPELSLRVALHD